MTEKPDRAAGYRMEHLERVRATCLYVATKLGDLSDEVVVVGGLVPALLVDQSTLSGNCVATDFLDLDALGPRRVAEFLLGRPDDEVQADVVGFVSTLLDRCGIGRKA